MLKVQTPTCLTNEDEFCSRGEDVPQLGAQSLDSVGEYFHVSLCFSSSSCCNAGLQRCGLDVVIRAASPLDLFKQLSLVGASEALMFV